MPKLERAFAALSRHARLAKRKPTLTLGDAGHRGLSPRLRIWLTLQHMEEGTKAKKTIFVGNLAVDVDETALLETFNAFGRALSAPLTINA